LTSTYGDILSYARHGPDLENFFYTFLCRIFDQIPFLKKTTLNFKNIDLNVKSVCLVNEKKHHDSANIKDLSQITFSQIDKLLLPDKRLVYRELDDEILEPYEKIYLKMSSIDKNAFVDLPNLKKLHLDFFNILNIDLEHMINLIEPIHPVNQKQMYNQILPANLQKLSIIGFPIRLESFERIRQI
jgi:hypothetical protein